MSSLQLSLPPLSLYIHIPWCIKKCPYCDFNSHQKKQGDLPETDYIKALLEDLNTDRDYSQERPLHSIFIGGGTPSLFSAGAYDFLLTEIDKIIPFEADMEITLEANPGTFEQQKFHDFRLAGINRLSIGIQSFNGAFLKSLGRIHDDNEAIRATDIAQQAGFENYNLDLMFGIPEQGVKDAIMDIQTAIDCSPQHISWYQLTIEPNTQYYSHPPTLPDEDTIHWMQTLGKQLLKDNSFSQYEISAYSQPGRQSRHNFNYWLFGDYLGIGAGAHGKITLPAEKKIIRTRKTRQPDHYLDPSKKFCAETITVPEHELALEFMMNAMRLCEGTNRDCFEARTGLPLSSIEKQLSKLSQLGLLEQNKIQASNRGQQFLNNLLSEFC